MSDALREGILQQLEDWITTWRVADRKIPGAWWRAIFGRSGGAVAGCHSGM